MSYCNIALSRTVRTWNFQWSTATYNNVIGDPTNWIFVTNTSRYKSVLAIVANSPIMANNIELTETKGLTVGVIAKNGLQIDFITGLNRLILNSPNLSLNVPNCVTGDSVFVVTETAAPGQLRGINAKNATRVSGDSISAESHHLNVFVANSDSAVVFTTTAALMFYSINVNLRPTIISAVNPVNDNRTVVNKILYNLNGTVAGTDFKLLKQGAYIQKVTYDNGEVISSKFLKPTD